MENIRNASIQISEKEFKKVGYELVDTIAQFHSIIGDNALTNGESPEQLQKILGADVLPSGSKSVGEIMNRATELLFNHSLFNGHPKFLGYITSSPAPIGVLADFLASAINQNVGAQILSPIATEIEKQTVKWLAEFIGVSSDFGGIIVSGGNMANFTGFLAGRNAKVKGIKEDGIFTTQKIRIYCPNSTHTWIEKAANFFGLGTNSIRWIETDEKNRMDISILKRTIEIDLENGCKPIMVIGTAGDVSTGAVDDFTEIGALCKQYDLWFHIDGAYGVPAAIIPGLKSVFEGLELADSIALDPHKWLYCPIEAGCTLVKNPKHLTDTYSSHAAYYNFDSKTETPATNFYEYGFQNTRGFKALKVWMALQQVGKEGYIKLIRDDIDLSRYLFDLANTHPELEAVTQGLSITTFRYIPFQEVGDRKSNQDELNVFNQKLLNILQTGGELFLSNAVVKDTYCLRACIVNFRTSKKDIEEIIDIVVREGRKLQLSNFK